MNTIHPKRFLALLICGIAVGLPGAGVGQFSQFRYQPNLPLALYEPMNPLTSVWEAQAGWGAGSMLSFAVDRTLRCGVLRNSGGWTGFISPYFDFQDLRPAGNENVWLSLGISGSGLAPGTSVKLEFIGTPESNKVSVSALVPGPEIGFLTFPASAIPPEQVQMLSKVQRIAVVFEGLGTSQPAFTLNWLEVSTTTGFLNYDGFTGPLSWAFKPGNLQLGAVDPVSTSGRGFGWPGGGFLRLPWKAPPLGTPPAQVHRAEMQTVGPRLNLSLANGSARMSFRARSSHPDVPIAVFLWQDAAGTGFSPPSVTLPSANEWHQVVLDLPWPHQFTTRSIDEIVFIADNLQLRAGLQGTVDIDQIEFTCQRCRSRTLVSQRTLVYVDDFENQDPSFNRRSGTWGTLMDCGQPAGTECPLPWEHGFVTMENAGVQSSAYRMGLVPGQAENGAYKYFGRYDSLAGKADYGEFTFDASRFRYMSFSVRNEELEPRVMNLKVELKEAGPDAGTLREDAYLHTALRIVHLDLPPGEWVRVNLPMDVSNRAEWTMNRHAPNPARLKQIVFVVERQYLSARQPCTHRQSGRWYSGPDRLALFSHRRPRSGADGCGLDATGCCGCGPRYSPFPRVWVSDHRAARGRAPARDLGL